MRWLLLTLVAAGAGFWLGRTSLSDLPERFRAPTPHEQYAHQLEVAGLDGAALGRLWERAAERAVAEAPRVEAPFRETGYLDSSRPDAVGYRFSARAGQRLTFEVRLEPATNALIFLDLFRVRDTGPDGPRAERVASADSGVLRLVHEPSRDGTYLIRVQPELLRGGRYTLTATTEPTMAFPVEGRGPGSVQSYFGDPRDGGRRDHHGIDIFAPRGTPVVATTRARVRSVRTTPVGGRVVWLRDEARSQSIYYAHLEEQLVERGMWVEPGDTLGLVGNSGNARTTPPHLHFGIYRRGVGPMDPLPFVRPLATEAPPAFAAEPGSMRRVTEPETRVRTGPTASSGELDRLDREVPVRVLGVAGDWLRIELPDGRRGWIAGRLTEPASPLRTAWMDAPAPLREAPTAESPEIARLAPGERVDVLGRSGDHLYVRAGTRAAWLPLSAPE
ncbi:MAG: peptidoglycan DD-metalloendopeptidase family protein [Longimicrobiales bacterium]|nr:peptidoglycan DD-metalloendopeptidase family protein [Longimicrobiales bacterium]